MRLGVPDWAIPKGDFSVPPGDASHERHQNDPGSHSRELCHMTKAQLLELAKELGVADAKPSMRKADMIELIEEADT